MTPADFINAARVPPTLRPREFGVWAIQHHEIDWPTARILGSRLGRFREYTVLRKWTAGTLHRDGGEVVMEDSARELCRHMPIWLAARGKILVTGLGLGCVVRGLLASPAVERIDVIEIDRAIARIVGAEFEGNSRVVLHVGDAFKMPLKDDFFWHFGWHDLHSDDNEPHLQIMHAELIFRFKDHVGAQGAWQLPRFFKRRARTLLGAERVIG